MNYKVLNTREEVTVITEVEYTLNNGEVIIVNVSHFMPKSEEDIVKGIENRLVTENNNLENLTENIIEE